MGKLAVFIQDTKDFTKQEAVGSGEVVYIHYRLRRGPFARRRLARFLAEKAEGCAVCTDPPCPLPEACRISGDAAGLIQRLADRFVPPGTEHLVLFPGRGWCRETVFGMARRVRFLEIIGGEEEKRLAEEISAETGLSVPVFRKMRPGKEKTVLRLPGAPAGCGLDLSEPTKVCRFVPPPSLRRVCSAVGTNGEILASLLSFFELPPEEAGVFLSNFTKDPVESEKDFI